MSAWSELARPFGQHPPRVLAFVALAHALGCSDAASTGAATNGSSAGGQVTAGAASVAGTGGATSGVAGASAGGAGASSGGGAGGSSTAGGGTPASDGGATAGSAGGGATGDDGGATGMLPACTHPHPTGMQALGIMSDGRQRKVRLFVPKGYDGATRLPLVLNLHGSSDNADNFAKSSEMEQVADSEGFVVAGLEAVAGSWNVPPADGMPDDVKYASDAIDAVAAAVCIDTRRVYASGFSGGGRMSSRLGCVLPDKLTAIGPVAGVRWPAPCPGRPVPVIAIHGLADSTNVYAGEGPEHPRWNESVEDAVLGWASKDGCSTTRVVDDPPGPLSTYSYAQCQGGASVRLVRMDGVEHAYPTGTPLHAAREVWNFVKGFSLP